MKKTTVYLPSELRRELKQAARREARSQADLMRAALEEYLKRPLPRSMGMGDDTEVSGRTARDWIRATWNGDEAGGDRPAPGFVGIADDLKLRGRDARDWLRKNWLPEA